MNREPFMKGIARGALCMGPLPFSLHHMSKLLCGKCGAVHRVTGGSFLSPPLLGPVRYGSRRGVNWATLKHDTSWEHYGRCAALGTAMFLLDQLTRGARFQVSIPNKENLAVRWGASFSMTRLIV